MTDLPKTAGFQTKTALRELLGSAGLSPRKRFGQHFLIDRNLLEKLVDAAELRTNDCILEVGCGTGSLTGTLAQTAGRVVAVEIDDNLVAIAQRQNAAHANIVWVHGDALRRKSAVAEEVDHALREAQTVCRGDMKLVANLPYDIATPLVIDLLLSTLPIKRMCFTVQAEVADRFLAEPNTSDYGPVGIITQVLCEGHRIAKVPPQAFWPEPKVASAMLRLDRRAESAVPVTRLHDFAHFVRTFFQYRRKTIANGAKQFDQPQFILHALEKAGLEAGARPENLTVSDWVHFHHGVK